MKPITQPWITKLVAGLVIPKLSNSLVRKEIDKVNKSKNIPAHYAKVLHRHKMFLKPEPEEVEEEEDSAWQFIQTTTGWTISWGIGRKES